MCSDSASYSHTRSGFSARTWMTPFGSLERCGTRLPGIAATASMSSSTIAVRIDVSCRHRNRSQPAASNRGPADDGSFTPIEQDGLPQGVPLEQALETIAWPVSVIGCAAVVERLVLPPEVDVEIPEDAGEAEQFAREHPLRQEVRIVAGATRAGASYCALRLRAHDDEQSVVDGTDLVPGLIQLLHATLEHGDLDQAEQADQADPQPPQNPRSSE